MEVIVNPKAKKIIPVFTVFCVLLLLFLVSVLICMKIIYRDYVTVDATITGVVHRRDNTGSTHHRGYSSYVQYEYSYEGKNYSSEAKVFSSFGKVEGTRLKIKCSPEHPEKIENVYMLRMLTICSAVLLFASILLLIFNFHK